MKKYITLLVAAAIAVLAFTQCTKDNPVTPLEVNLTQQNVELRCTEPLTVEYTATNVSGDLLVAPLENIEGLSVANAFDTAKNAGAITLKTTSNAKNQFTVTLVFQDGKSVLKKEIIVTTKSIWTMGIDEPINYAEE